jgi:diaminohydroxyphosphoribosylaminopyrimidine deaminase/5-amino-6-(5-phosphoribosylamino)uracil reductase
MSSSNTLLPTATAARPARTGPDAKLPTVIHLALELARQAQNLSAPNPAVGCVLVSPSGELIGQGHTQAVGSAHAEVMALRDAAARGHATTGATAYVTLEPCSHQGRTGPCCNALVSAGIAKVVAAIADPNPLVAGQGFERLRAAGIQVEVGPGAEASRELNIGFFSRMLRQTPWVRMKTAASLDGSTALANGQSQWITSPEARADGHAWRARASAVLTGIGTVLQDDPGLDVRLVPTSRQPQRIVIDSGLQTPLDARIFKAGGEVWIYTASTDEAATQALQARGASVTCLPGAGGKVDLAAVMRDLGRRQVNELHVEAGFKLNGSLVREGLVDEFLVYLAPKLLGPGQGMFALPELQSLANALPLEFMSAERIGPDLRLLARVQGRGNF